MKTKAREGWGKKFKQMAAHKEDRLLMPDNIDAISQVKATIREMLVD